MIGLFSDSQMAGLLRHLPHVDAPQDYTPPTHFPNLRRARRLTVDLETHDPDLPSKGPGPRRDGYIVGVSINADGNFQEYYPLRHADGPNCNPDHVISWLRDNMNPFRGEIIGANLLYDFDYLQYEGVEPKQAKIRDVQFAEPLLDEHALSYSLEALATKYLDQHKETDWLKSLYGADVKKHMREVHPSHMRKYALPDVNLPGPILDKQVKQLGKERLVKLFDLECRLIPLLLYMRRRGVRVDLERAAQADVYLAKKRDAALLAMKRIVGFEVDPDSGPTIARACGVLGVQYMTTDKGNPSFTGPWLRQVAAVDWIDELDEAKLFFRYLLDARKYERARNPFITNYILGSHINGRIHAEFHPLRRAGGEDGEGGTVSGRFSSSHPNLQNIPSRDDEIGPLLRSLFIPDEGRDWFSADYSQFEYRFLVHFACKHKWPDNEKGRAARDSAFRAREMYQKDPATDFHKMGAEITHLERKHAKSINYGVSYGMGFGKMAALMGVDEDGARDIIGQYDEAMPYVRSMFNVASEIAQERGFVRTILGRKARFELWEPDTREGFLAIPYPLKQAVANYGDKLRRARTHKALNCIMQGSNADAIKLAMVNAWENGFTGPDKPLDVLITVHDELDGNVTPGLGNQAFEQLQEIMRSAVQLEVPVLVDGKIGRNWSETH